MDELPDDAFVVRAGRNHAKDIRSGMGMHPSGVTGVSVESAAEFTVAELAVNIPHGQLGVTTVGEDRRLGGHVIPTSGRSPQHATLTGLTADQISELLTPTISNSIRKKD